MVCPGCAGCSEQCGEAVSGDEMCSAAALAAAPLAAAYAAGYSGGFAAGVTHVLGMGDGAGAGVTPGFGEAPLTGYLDRLLAERDAETGEV